MLDHLDMLDEAHIAAVNSAIAEGRISIFVQDICNIEDPTKVLYSECFACLIDSDGTFHRASEFIPSLDALGATPSLDRHILKLVLDRLAADPNANLGCNLSLNTITDEENWSHIYDQITSRSQLAPRLVLEVTETPLGIDAMKADDFLAMMQKLGCRIAIDDFGVGYFSFLRQPERAIDIVKINASLFHEDYQGGNGYKKLGHMVGLAGLTATNVVITDIELTSQLEMAKGAGATHAQGYLFSMPSELNSGNQ